MVSPPFLGWDGGFFFGRSLCRGDGARRANRPRTVLAGQSPASPGEAGRPAGPAHRRLEQTLKWGEKPIPQKGEPGTGFFPVYSPFRLPAPVPPAADHPWRRKAADPPHGSRPGGSPRPCFGGFKNAGGTGQPIFIHLVEVWALVTASPHRWHPQTAPRWAGVIWASQAFKV